MPSVVNAISRKRMRRSWPFGSLEPSVAGTRPGGQVTIWAREPGVLSSQLGLGVDPDERPVGARGVHDDDDLAPGQYRRDRRGLVVHG